jgi:hypothetical protein
MALAHYETTRARALAASVVGALVGAIALELYLLTLVVATGPVSFSLLLNAISDLPVLALFIWLGLVIIGVPCWLLLHRAGFRAWQHLAAAGAVAFFAVTYAIESRVVFTDHAMSSASRMALLGALVGVAIWRVAYRKVGATAPV